MNPNIIYNQLAISLSIQWQWQCHKLLPGRSNGADKEKNATINWAFGSGTWCQQQQSCDNWMTDS